MSAAQALAALMRPTPATPGITDPLTGPRPTWRWQSEATPDYDATVAQLGDPHTVDAIPEPEPPIEDDDQDALTHPVEALRAVDEAQQVTT